jgi:hypothetical protein
MAYVSFLLGEDVAPTCIRQLGHLKCVQFVDVRPLPLTLPPQHAHTNIHARARAPAGCATVSSGLSAANICATH